MNYKVVYCFLLSYAQGLFTDARQWIDITGVGILTFSLIGTDSTKCKLRDSPYTGILHKFSLAEGAPKRSYF